MPDFVNRNINIFSSVLAIISGLIFGLIIMFITNPVDTPSAFITIITGGFQEGLESISRVLYYATPIILTGLSVGFAFKTGLFNIGASGQVMLGAFTSIYIGVKWTHLGSIQWLVALFFAGVAGSIWALLPGILKAYRSVHEVVSTIMMNYIGLYLVIYLIKLTVFNRAKNETYYVNRNAVIPVLKLGNLSISYGFIIALLVVIIINILLNKTTFGYELKAVGFNKEASIYAGINAKKNIIFSLLISGFLSGLAGGIIYLNNIGRALEVVDVLVPEGFTGIPVALIGLSNPIGILFAGLFMGYITLGGFYMQIYNFAPEIIDVIIASIIYFSALVVLFREIIIRISKRKSKRGDSSG